MAEGTLVFIDNGYLSKISKHFGNGSHMRISLTKFAENLARKQSLSVRGIYLYTAPPYIDSEPSEEDIERKRSYDRFVAKMRTIQGFHVREGRLQKIDGRFTQKGVDTLLTMDLMREPKSKGVKTIVVLACDTDFVPIFNSIRKEGVKIVLYFYNDFVRKSQFSMSNEILTACDKKILLTEKDFKDSLHEKI